MTVQEKKIKLAEAGGWRIEKANFHTMHVWEPGAKLPARLSLNIEDKIPNYFKDLNAVHKLEKLLTDEQHFAFRMNLWNITIELGEDDVWDRHFISATATQRCEAIGKTLNLW
jgi:hypothetical protein